MNEGKVPLNYSVLVSLNTNATQSDEAVLCDTHRDSHHENFQMENVKELNLWNQILSSFPKSSINALNEARDAWTGGDGIFGKQWTDPVEMHS